jgi:hypothetical protein
MVTGSHPTSANPKKISSNATVFYKRVFPVLWFGFLAIFLLMSVFAIRAGGEAHFPFLIVPVAMAGFGYLILRRFVFDLLDEVWDAGDHLVLKKGGLEDRVPLTNIMNVSSTVAINPPRVTLTLRQPCRFGREVTFSPPSTWVPMRQSPLVDELIERVDRARGG